MPELGEVTHEHFAELEDETFTLEIGGESVEVDLVDVEVGEPLRALPHARTPFTLVFRGDEELSIPGSQGVCTLTHSGVGELDVFLVMIGPDEEGHQQVQAVFN